MYTCKKCQVLQPLTNFYKTTDRKCGHKTTCKGCLSKNPLTESRKKRMRDYGKDYNLKMSYNMTREEYNQLLAFQNHKCAICEADETTVAKGKLHVDHCHETGKVRALLCHNCNVSLGLLKESINTLTKAIAYLNKQGE